MKELLLNPSPQTRRVEFVVERTQAEGAAGRKSSAAEFSRENLQARSETVTEVLRRIMNRPVHTPANGA